MSAARVTVERQAKRLQRIRVEVRAARKRRSKMLETTDGDEMREAMKESRAKERELRLEAEGETGEWFKRGA